MSIDNLKKYAKPSNYFKYARWKFGRKYKISYSQRGEDILISFIFRSLEILKPSYIDIGANDPIRASNTALLYQAGSHGINIEPNPVLFKKLVTHRKRDVNLNVGIAGKQSMLELYIMNVPSLSTFSKEEASRMAKEYGFVIKKIVPTEVSTVTEIVTKHSNGQFPDLLTLDVEGLDEQILRSIDFNKNRPKVICVETISFSIGRNGVKNNTLIDFLKGKDYLLVADTYINSLFVDAALWNKNAKR